MTTGRAPAFEPVPLELATVLDPHWLAEALDVVDGDDRIVGVEQVGASRTVAEKVRFVVTVEGAGGVRSHALCAKAHFDDGLNSLLTEAHVYRDLRPRLAVRAPRAYYTGIDADAHRGLIVMDDVAALGGRFLAAHEPYSVATCRDALSQLAVLHAGTWGDPQWDVDWLAPRISRMASLLPTDALQDLLDDGRGSELPAFLRDARTLQAAMRRTAELAPTCVLHGDTHSGNAYLDGDGRVCWLDWQITQRGHWSIDVSYHLGTALDVETRRAQEAPLLRHYLDELRSQGVDPPSFDEAWEQYTLGFTWGYFLWVITRISSRAVVLLHIPRLGAALADHDTFRRLGVA
ncbi:MAG TPA: phosphotransferase [Acidimicrobiales bacterium]|nr:phosphotransferase [Acidimicrobiales bacterium]